jgi:hypothetical protein
VAPNGSILTQQSSTLGEHSSTINVLNRFDVGDLPKFKHVALPWYQFSNIAKACQRLATVCPALRTLIIQRGKVESTAGQPFRQILSLKTAAYYANIPKYTGPELGYAGMDVSYFRSLLLQYFGVTPLRLHLLSPDWPHDNADPRVNILPTV